MYSSIIRLSILIFLVGMSFQTFAKTEKYRCMWRSDPATTMTIGWNQLSGNHPTLYYDIYDHGSDAQAYSWSQNPDRSVTAKGMNNQFVRLTGLQPNTVYYFMIVDSEGISTRMSFQTAPDHPYERLSIIAGGDSRNHRKGRKNANKLVSKLRPHCVMFGGDMTGSDKAREWKYWFDDWQHTIGQDGRLTPLIVARGNHEYSNASITDLFDVENPKIFYALNLGGNLLRVYTLNSLIASGGDQGQWLQSDLSRSDNMIWKFAQYHFAIRPHTRAKSEQNGQYKNWAIPFHQHGVDMVVESDAHVVKTTWPIRPTKETGNEQGFIRDDENGTVYIGEGCWGAPLRRANDDKKWTRNSGSFNQFKWIFVAQDDIEVRTVETNNADEVGEVDPYDIFSPPANLKIWSPDNGPVLRIEKQYQQQYASTTTDETAVASIHPMLTTTDASEIPAPVVAEEVICDPKEEEAEPSIVAQKDQDRDKEILAGISVPMADKSATDPVKQVKVAPKEPKSVPTKKSFIPASITNCRAVLEATQIAIKWEVKNESDQPYQFEVQRSTGGDAFRTIARLQGVGTQGNKTNQYRILDQLDPAVSLAGTNYQILATDPNGGTSIFAVDQSATVAQQWNEHPKITPDPNSGLLKVRYELNQASDVVIKLTGFNDKPISKSSYSDQKSGNYQKSIDMKNIPKGVYLLTIQIGQDMVKQYQVLKEQKKI